jgi:hypothetical protein
VVREPTREPTTDEPAVETSDEPTRRARRDAAAATAAEGVGEFARPGAEVALWFGVLGPPMLLLLHQQLNYMLVPWTCRHDAPLVLHLVSLVLIAATIFAGLVAHRLWRETGGGITSYGAGPIPRSRFLALVGMASSALSALTIFGQWLAILFITPCRGA